MKRQFPVKLILVLGLLLTSFSSVSSQTAFGLQGASYFRTNSSAPFYIQVGSYRNKSNALRIKLSLQNKTSQPVLLRKKNGYYVIIVGPIHSAAAVRTTAQELTSTSAEIRVAKIKSRASSKVIRPQPRMIQSKQTARHTPKMPAVKMYKDKDGFPLSPSNRWYVGVSVGWMFPFGTNDSSFANSGMPGFPDDRYSADSAKNMGQYSVLAAYQWRRATEWLPAYSLGVQYTYASSARINGFIFVNDLPDTKNFKYKYDISQQLVMAKLKLDLYRWQQLMPYISGGAGVAFNRVDNYSEGPIPGATVWQRRYRFTSGTKSQFAGSLGAGLDYGFSDKAQVSLGYELSYYGKASTGKGQGVLSANRLENKLNSNAVVLQGVYFFDW